MKIEGLDLAGLPESQQMALKRAYAAKIAAACSLPSSDSVWDLMGDNGTTTFTEGLVEAFVAIPQGSYANRLARSLYAPAFKEELLQTTVDGAPRASAVGPVILQLERFQRQVITATLTSTTSTVTTVTTTEAATTTEATTEPATTRVHHDVAGTSAGALRGKNNANRAWSLRWCEVLLAGFVVANMVS